jgi:hypothetical protein
VETAYGIAGVDRVFVRLYALILAHARGHKA